MATYRYRYLHPSPSVIDGVERQQGDEFESNQDLRRWSYVATLKEPEGPPPALDEASEAQLIQAARAKRVNLGAHMSDTELTRAIEGRGLSISADAPLDVDGSFQVLRARVRALSGGAVTAASRDDLITRFCEHMLTAAGLTDEEEPAP